MITSTKHTIFALALLTIAGYGVSKSVNGNADLSLLALSNVEALANGEGGGDYCDIYCTPAQGWKCTVYVNGVPWLPCYDYRKPHFIVTL